MQATGARARTAPGAAKQVKRQRARPTRPNDISEAAGVRSGFPQRTGTAIKLKRYGTNQTAKLHAQVTGFLVCPPLDKKQCAHKWSKDHCFAWPKGKYQEPKRTSEFTKSHPQSSIEPECSKWTRLTASSSKPPTNECTKGKSGISGCKRLGIQKQASCLASLGSDWFGHTKWDLSRRMRILIWFLKPPFCSFAC